MKITKIIFPVLLLSTFGQLSFAQDVDQCEFIREAITNLPEEGGEILIPQGTFNCKKMIVLNKDNTKLIGAGRDLTILRLADKSHAPVLVIGDSKVTKNLSGDWVTVKRVKNIEVSDLTVDGNLANQDYTRECGNGPCDGDITNIRNNAITIRGASFVNLTRVTAKNSISGGLVTEKYCDHLKVSDFSSYGNHFDGFAGYQTSHSLFKNMNLSRNRGAGISIDIDFNKNHFLGGTLDSNGDVGIFARDTNDVIFEKLDITNSGNHGAFLAASEYKDTCANRNEFRSVNIEGSKGNGIHIADQCKDNIVTGNSVFSNNSSGCYYVHYQTWMFVEPQVICR